ncbi:crystal protein-like [Clavelina lepadiformis]|uniref:crystal protein-like n=1 Tax=Clavelina lepadiformis TaxID=159417 RepID=UPI00404199C9
MRLVLLLPFLPMLALASQDPVLMGLEVALSKVIGGVKFNTDHFIRAQGNTKISNSTVIDNPKVNTTSGVVTGATTAEGHAFYSVPYGEAPIGELRFKAPVPRNDKGPIDGSGPDYVNCFEFPLNCTSDDKCNKYYSEDCLRLNVFVPPTIDFSSPPGGKNPVMVWLHGGGFYAGSGTLEFYDAAKLSHQTNTIIVSVNYRLGPLGFLVFDENGTRLFEGNQGIKDQQLAMQWVQDNIEKFGGNKSMVTLFGQSAGAQSIMYHLMSPVSEPLFHRVIMESNPASFPYPTQEEAINTVTKGLLRALNCTGSELQCLMDAPAYMLLELHVQTLMFNENPDLFFIIEPYRPVLDGVEINEQPLDFFQSGKWQNNKEVIIGVMKDEEAFVNALLKNTILVLSMFESFLNWIVGPENGEKVVEKYSELAGNPGPGYDYTNLLAQAAADLLFVCPTRALTRFMSETSTLSKPSVYLYVDHHPLSGDACVLNPDLCGYAYHTLDIYYVFNVESVTSDVFAANDTAVASQFSKFWGNFAYYGAPSKELTEWPPYVSSMNGPSIEEWTSIRLEAPTTSTEYNFRQDLCDFWDSLDFYMNFTSIEETAKVTATSPGPTKPVVKPLTTEKATVIATDKFPMLTTAKTTNASTTTVRPTTITTGRLLATTTSKTSKVITATTTTMESSLETTTGACNTLVANYSVYIVYTIICTYLLHLLGQ